MFPCNIHKSQSKMPKFWRQGTCEVSKAKHSRRGFSLHAVWSLFPNQTTNIFSMLPLQWDFGAPEKNGSLSPTTNQYVLFLLKPYDTFPLHSSRLKWKKSTVANRENMIPPVFPISAILFLYSYTVGIINIFSR